MHTLKKTGGGESRCWVYLITNKRLLFFSTTPWLSMLTLLWFQVHVHALPFSDYMQELETRDGGKSPALLPDHVDGSLRRYLLKSTH